MSITVNDVESWMGVADDSLDADIMTRVVAAVNDHAARHYDLTDETDEHDQALIMQAAAWYNRRFSPGGWSGADDLNPVQVRSFDPDIARMLSGRLIVAGIFGPSESTAE